MQLRGNTVEAIGLWAGANAPVRWVGGTYSGAPTVGTYLKGDFVVDSSGAVWICTTAGSPGTWSAPGGAAPRVNTTASSATPAIDVATTDVFKITALATAVTSMTSGLTGSPSDGQRLLLRITDNGTVRAITWGASFESGPGTLLTTTVAGQTHTLSFIYDSVKSLWVCLAADATGY